MKNEGNGAGRMNSRCRKTGWRGEELGEVEHKLRWNRAELCILGRKRRDS